MNSFHDMRHVVPTLGNRPAATKAAISRAQRAPDWLDEAVAVVRASPTPLAMQSLAEAIHRHANTLHAYCKTPEALLAIDTDFSRGSAGRRFHAVILSRFAAAKLPQPQN